MITDFVFRLAIRPFPTISLRSVASSSFQRYQFPNESLNQGSISPHAWYYIKTSFKETALNLSIAILNL